MGIKESLDFHESKLEFEFGFDSKVLANAEINPKYRTVQHWHNIWRTENLGPRDGVGLLEVGTKTVLKKSENNCCFLFFRKYSRKLKFMKLKVL